MHLLAERFVFGSDDQGFLKRKSRPIKWHQCRLLTRQLYLCLHICSLWRPLSRKSCSPDGSSNTPRGWPVWPRWFVLPWSTSCQRTTRQTGPPLTARASPRLPCTGSCTQFPSPTCASSPTSPPRRISSRSSTRARHSRTPPGRQTRFSGYRTHTSRFLQMKNRSYLHEPQINEGLW